MSAGDPDSRAGLTAVIFDLGGVVLDSPLHFIGEFERDNDLPGGLVARLVGGYGIAAGGQANPWHALERGELSVHDFYQVFEDSARALGHQFDARSLMQGISTHCGIRPVMVEAIRALRGAGLKVAALTNIWAAPDGFDERLDALQGEFDAFIESYRVGMRKPEAEIYETTCRAIDIRPTEAVFLDDIGSNLKAARSMGMMTIKVQDPTQALNQLGRLFELNLAGPVNRGDDTNV